MRKKLADFHPGTVLARISAFAQYDQDRGGFIRIHRTNGPHKNQQLGELIGSDDHQGYLRVSLFGFKFRIHVLVWAIETGDWPQNNIDHIDGNSRNNHISNLRDVTQAENLKNARAKSNNTTGYTGVSFCNRTAKYRAEVTHRYQVVYRYSCDTPEEAYAARQTFIAAHPEMGFTARHGE